jgi:hypothetical protein
MNASHPAASWSGFLKGISIAVAALLSGVSLLAALTMPTHVPPGLRMLAIALPLVILLAAVPFVVRGYELRDGTLYVRRLCWTTRVALGGLREAAIDPQAGAGSIRLFGNGGLFSFSGWFRNAKLGRYRAFVTDWQRAVVLRSVGGTVVLSPADPASFVDDLKMSLAPKRTARPRPDYRRL